MSLTGMISILLLQHKSRCPQPGQHKGRRRQPGQHRLQGPFQMREAFFSLSCCTLRQLTIYLTDPLLAAASLAQLELLRPIFAN